MSSSRKRKSRSSHRDRSSSSSSSSSKETTKPSFPLLTDDDFFARSVEFRVWLKEKERRAFDELSAARARELFHKFVKKWNRGRLAAKFYAGTVSSSDLGHSSHKWGFASKLDDQGRRELDALRQRVALDTSKTAATASSTSATAAAAVVAAPVDVDWEERRRREKSERKRHEKRVEVALDEIAPKLEGREKARADRRERGSYARPEDQGDFLTVAVEGGGADAELQRMLARERERNEKRQSAKLEHSNAVIQAHASRESAVMDQFKSMLSQQALDANGRAVIRPRPE